LAPFKEITENNIIYDTLYSITADFEHEDEHVHEHEEQRVSQPWTAACLDASVAKRITKSDRIGPGKELLARIVAMLTRLVGRFNPDEFRIREDGINA
jgi:hypothetical protein